MIRRAAELRRPRRQGAPRRRRTIGATVAEGFARTGYREQGDHPGSRGLGAADDTGS